MIHFGNLYICTLLSIELIYSGRGGLCYVSNKCIVISENEARRKALQRIIDGELCFCLKHVIYRTPTCSILWHYVRVVVFSEMLKPQQPKLNILYFNHNQSSYTQLFKYSIYNFWGKSYSWTSVLDIWLVDRLHCDWHTHQNENPSCLGELWYLSNGGYLLMFLSQMRVRANAKS